jgi:hypothetical protein
LKSCGLKNSLPRAGEGKTSPRHCEERSDVAIQAAIQFSGTPEPTERQNWIATGYALAMTVYRIYWILRDVQ